MKNEHSGHNSREMADRHKGHAPEMFLRRFWASLILTLPVLAYSEIFLKIFRFSPPDFKIAFFGSELSFGILAPLVFGSVVFFYGGSPFIRGAFNEIKMKLPGMMTLVGLAVSAAYFFSVYAVFSGREPLFWELTTLICVMLLGHWLEMAAVKGASAALKELAKLLPDEAEILKNGEPKKIPLGELKIGDIVFVRPGAKIPADGIVLEGESEANESMMTGESAPVKKTKGSETIAGAINGSGALKIRVAKIGEQTFLAGVARLVSEAEASKSHLQILSDKAAFYLTLIAVFSGGLAFVYWISAGAGAPFAFERLVAVLVIACPHALGLAVPLAASISVSLGAKNGLLIRRREAFEAARKIDIVLFDKTGTLTKGEYGVEKIFNFSAFNDDEILRLAASLDAASEHLISKAIVAEAKKRNLEFYEVKNFKRIPGAGVSGEIKGGKIFAGGEAILSEIPDSKFPLEKRRTPEEVAASAKQGKTIIYVIAGENLIGTLALADLIREESKTAAAELENLGVKTAMITGDSEEAARWVASELGIGEYFARVLPSEKAEKVKFLQSKNLKVAMVGDGINDAPALVQADLGVAVGAGTNVAIESAGVILVKNDPRDIVKIIKLSRATYFKMTQNIFWATFYNIAALPLAAGILIHRGITLEPAVSALFMSLSTVIVAFNAALLKRMRF